MKIIKEGFFLGVLALISMVVACNDPVQDELESQQKVYEDSLAQAQIDSSVIVDYWDANDYGDTLIYSVSGIEGRGVRYVILEDGTGDYPVINDIVSIHYVGKFTDGTIFDTSIDTLALMTDSLAWVEVWKDYPLADNDFSQETLYVGETVDDNGTRVSVDTIDVTGMTTGEKLTELAFSSEPLDITLYYSSRSFTPTTYNHTETGTGIPSNFVSGYRTGLHALTPYLNHGASGLMMFPSVLGYGVYGTAGANGTGSDVIPGNTVIVFEIYLQNIRP
ncbi:FKBP-type peptidyl-prolyl cis-trans isomerase [Reichenbachiella agariperforans]|uniref:FKBP-type peptidyl-prolyl cis-trans isomerase n=1 Tax=Reichenbachiella agariperforans TaxID=156994 RepID=UPI001C081E7D|nr:FKBP-type peptidyl-prolyl cis-trans isomerase [Reichenbachiella agariperforans]MBU2915295.1 FKBP-type peptidyl-prolyl cis-trans isomerase [Reichenbachiella agariperforans]